MKNPKREFKMGKVQLRIMQFLWQHGEASAREISDGLAVELQLSHSTIQTLLRKLENKGAVKHAERDRIFLFSPIATQSEVAISSTRAFLDQVFSGSASELVAHLLEHETLTNQELDEMRTMIETHRRSKP